LNQALNDEAFIRNRKPQREGMKKGNLVKQYQSPGQGFLLDQGIGADQDFVE
jgi:hypothetical protein